jgi:hypothetical protein
MTRLDQAEGAPEEIVLPDLPPKKHQKDRKCDRTFIAGNYSGIHRHLSTRIKLFGFVILIWGIVWDFVVKEAFETLNLPVLIIVGSMLSLSKVMQQNNAFVPLTQLILPIMKHVPQLFFSCFC